MNRRAAWKAFWQLGLMLGASALMCGWVVLSHTALTHYGPLIGIAVTVGPWLVMVYAYLYWANKEIEK
jgi:hypothetical protein